MKLIAIFLLITLSSIVNANFDDAYGHLKQKEYIKALKEIQTIGRARSCSISDEPRLDAS